MNERALQAVVDQPTLADRVAAGEYPEWVRRHWESFSEGVTGERDGTPFPCHFGTESVRNGEPLYTVVPSLTDPDALLGLRDALLEYLDVYRQRDGRASFVTFWKPPEASLSEADYHEALWHVLNFLHVHDPEPWPEDIPTETDHPEWEFCFGGEPLFPTCRAPFYDEHDRYSRHCPVGLEITFQPRGLFDGITADTEAGQHAREVIQDRIEDYDGQCPHADLGDWGVEGDREWVQYLFREDESQAPDECPVTFTREHPKATAGVDPVVGSRGASSTGSDD
jgi:FPC/CPF motif-containing protein YcgG